MAVVAGLVEPIPVGIFCSPESSSDEAAWQVKGSKGKGRGKANKTGNTVVASTPSSALVAKVPGKAATAKAKLQPGQLPKQGRGGRGNRGRGRAGRA